MTEPDKNEQQFDKPQHQFVLQKIYTKDLSFETPNAPGIFTENWEPNVNVELNTKGKKLSDDVHEVILGVTVTVKVGEKVAYLVEVQQAGIFTISGFADQELGGMIGSYCPNLLFPYAREVISDLVVKGGFPQMLLAPVNFDAVYMEHLERQKGAIANGGKKPAPVH